MDPGKVLVGATVGLLVVAAGVFGVAVFHGDLLSGTPDDVSQLDDEDLPDGITTTGVHNASAAAADHRASLSDTSFTLHLQANRTTGDGGSGVTLNQTVRSDRDGDILMRAERTGSRTVSQTVWTNGSVAVRRVTRNEDSVYQRIPPREVQRGATGRIIIEQILAAGDFQPDEVITREGTQLVVLRADRSTGNAASALGVQSVSSLTGTVLVDADGRVHSMSVEFTYTNDQGVEVHQSLTQRLSGVGSTTVERPSWVSDALASSETGRLTRAGVYRAHDVSGWGSTPDP